MASIVAINGKKIAEHEYPEAVVLTGGESRNGVGCTIALSVLGVLFWPLSAINLCLNGSRYRDKPHRCPLVLSVVMTLLGCISLAWFGMYQTAVINYKLDALHHIYHHEGKQYGHVVEDHHFSYEDDDYHHKDDDYHHKDKKDDGHHHEDKKDDHHHHEDKKDDHHHHEDKKDDHHHHEDKKDDHHHHEDKKDDHHHHEDKKDDGHHHHKITVSLRGNKHMDKDKPHLYDMFSIFSDVAKGNFVKKPHKDWCFSTAGTSKSKCAPLVKEKKCKWYSKNGKGKCYTPKPNKSWKPRTIKKAVHKKSEPKHVAIKSIKIAAMSEKHSQKQPVAARSNKNLIGMMGPVWTRGGMEKPLGTKSMGTWTKAVYTKEQQTRLKVDENGKKVA